MRISDWSSDVCASYLVWPVRTNAAFLARALDDPDFLAGSIDTGFIEAHQDALIPPDDAPEAVLTAAARALMTADPATPWGGLSCFRLNAPAAAVIAVEEIGRAHV